MPDSDFGGRRSNDVQLAELVTEFKSFSADFHEIKQLLLQGVLPRITNLEEWRVALAATQLERDRNQKQQEAGLVSKRQFWFGVVTIIFGVAGSMSALLAVITPHA